MQKANHEARRANGDTGEAGPCGAALRVTIRIRVTAGAAATNTKASMISRIHAQPCNTFARTGAPPAASGTAPAA